MDYLKGKFLLNQQNKQVLADEVLGHSRLIVFFFSAGWCHHSEAILPILIKTHEEAKKRMYALDIIFVSSDLTPDAMYKHFKEQGNWYSVAWDDVLAEELRRMFTVTHIPFIVAVTTSGYIISKNGYQELLKNGVNVLINWSI